jgi:hypothetical protein
MATAYLVKYSQQLDVRACSEIRVSLRFEQQKIVSSTCSDCKNEVWCEHIIAACLYRIRNPEKVFACLSLFELEACSQSFVNLFVLCLFVYVEFRCKLFL